MTCDQLVRQGPPADGQVTLTDLKACSKGIVFTRFDHSLDLYVPAYSTGAEKEPDPPDLPFLLQVWSDEDRERLLVQPGPVEATCWATKRVRAVEVSRGPGQVEQWARDGVEQKYPGIRLADVTVLTFGHGSTPTAERVQSAWQYGIGELVLGGAMLILGGVLAGRQLGMGKSVS
jgi:hypothetical protein